MTNNTYFELLGPLTVSRSIAFLLFFILSHRFTRQTSGILRYNSSRGFLSCPECSKMAAKRPTSPTHVECQKSQKALCIWIWCPLSCTPFFEKGPTKITEGSPFDSHWPISRINPAVRTSDLSLEVRGAPVGHKRNCTQSPYTFSFRLRLRMNQ